MFLVPIPRTVAKERGLKHYDSTSFCKFGNISKRLVSNFTCLCNSCKKEKYSKVKDYKKTPKAKELRKIVDQNYYKKNKEIILSNNKIWRDGVGSEIKKLADKKWVTENRDKVNLSQRKHYYNNLQEQRARRRLWNMKNRPKKAMYTFERRLLTSYAYLKSELTDFVFEQSQELAQKREALLGIKIHVDHMIPLKAKNTCGLHVWNNFQCLPSVMNSSKGNKLIYTNPHEWLYDIPKFFKVVYQQEIAT